MKTHPSDTRWQQVADWLGTASAHRQAAEVRVIETHISCIYLAGDRAYKLKKPVQYDFLDYRSVEARRAACVAEVELNRRLADDVYQGVVPIRQDDRGELSLGGDGQPVEWVVQMRRLNETDTLQSRLADGRLTDDHVAGLVDRLSAFYRQAPALRPPAYRQDIEQHVRANGTELVRPEFGLDQATVDRVHQAQLRTLLLMPDLFDRRVEAGRIVDGHGDLRPEHIYLTPRPQIIDCIEFSAEFRRLDVADELCFLEMECDRLGAGDVGRRIAEDCFRQLQDEPPTALLAFYRGYRACVRAKVAALRAAQVQGEAQEAALATARRYLEMAEREASSLPGPVLLVVRGLMGSGKSTLARWLSEKLGALALSSDVVRQELFPKPLNPSLDRPRFDEDLYQPTNRQRVYEELFRRAERELAAGRSVILDATFVKAANRQQAALLATSLGALFLTVYCDCPADVAKARIAARIAGGRDASEARPELYEQQARENEPDSSEVYTYSIDSRQAISIMGDQVLTELRRRMAR